MFLVGPNLEVILLCQGDEMEHLIWRAFWLEKVGHL